MTTATPSVDDSCSFDDFTATAAGEIASIAACETAVGDISIEGEDVGTLELNGVQQIYGNLKINGTQASTLNAATLQLVSGELTINQNTNLNSMDLAQLTTVGTLSLTALPNIEKTGLTSGITSAESVIVANTGLSTLSGINVHELKVFDVNNNNAIELIDSGLQKVTDRLSISYNADQVDLKFDELTEAKNIYLQSISSFSFKNLTKVGGSLSLSSSAVDSIEFATLGEIGNSLTITKNDDLTEIEFSNLTSIGGALAIADNEQLSSFGEFPELQKVGGSVSLNGSFDNGTLPSIERISGGFNLRSSGDLTCEEFNDLNSDGDVKGDKYYCSGADAETSSSSSKSGNENGVSTGSSGDGDDDDSGDSNSTDSDSGASATGFTLFSIVSAAMALGITLY